MAKVIIYGIGKVKCSECGTKGSTTAFAGAKFCKACGTSFEAWNYESNEVKMQEADFLRKKGANSGT